MITTIMASFAFGYCVMDIIQNYLAKRRIDEIVRDAINREVNSDVFSS